MTSLRFWSRALALAVGTTICIAVPAARAQSPAPVQDDIAVCTVRVAAVKAVDGEGTAQAVVFEPTLDGSATLSGTVALFTADDLRFDVPFRDVHVSSSGTPSAIAYRFARPVTITGAYVSALDGPSPGPCTLAYPWSKRMPQPPDARANAALDRRTAADPVTTVDGPGTPDPLACPVPFQPARTLSAAMPAIVPDAHGTIYVNLALGADGKPFGASVDKIVYDGDSPLPMRAAAAEAVRAALASTFETQIFRCRHVIDRYYFLVRFN